MENILMFEKLFSRVRKRLDEFVKDEKISNEERNRITFGTMTVDGDEIPVAHENNNEEVNKMIQEDWKKIEKKY